MKKILYLFSDTGGGHRAAANSLIKAVDELKSRFDIEQKKVDVFAVCSGFLSIFARLYGPVIKYTPAFWGKLFYWFDQPNRLKNLQKLSKPFIHKELALLLAKEKPDLIVSVHPLLNHLVVDAKKEINLKAPIITVVMDPIAVHRSWICPEVDLIVVATKEAKRKTIEFGAEEKKVKVIGIPIDPRFSKVSEKKEAFRQKLGLKKDMTTVLIIGGGEGAGKIDKIVAVIDQANLNLQLVIICGRNKKLKLKLEKQKKKSRIPMVIFGFSEEVPEIMELCDLVITKGGPGAVAEALAKDLPMIVTSWLPGQEDGNVEFVKKEKVGEVEKDYHKLPQVIKKMLAEENLKKYKKNISRVKNPRAVYEIAKLILKTAIT